MKKSDFYTVEQAGKKLGLGRVSAYAAAKRGDFPTVKVGRSIRVPKRLFDVKFGLVDAKAEIGMSQQAPVPPRMSLTVYGSDLADLCASLRKLLADMERRS